MVWSNGSFGGNEGNFIHQDIQIQEHSTFLALDAEDMSRVWVESSRPNGLTRKMLPFLSDTLHDTSQKGAPEIGFSTFKRPTTSLQIILDLPLIEESVVSILGISEILSRAILA